VPGDEDRPAASPTVAPRPIGGTFTFGGRQGRMSPTRRRAMEELVPRYTVDTAGRAPARRPIIVEIGCGAGEATAAMATGDSHSLVIACEPNTAMIANLAILLDAQGITNVRLWPGDAFEVLAWLGPASVADLRVWFPDPWPKPRQARRRLIVPERLAVLADSLVDGGRLRLATDDAGYATEALAAIAADPRLVGEVVHRPGERPITRFEARGVREGRTPIDIVATREPRNEESRRR
jgi:tRNA (guanine-N7-)-methyltransferase